MSPSHIIMSFCQMQKYESRNLIYWNVAFKTDLHNANFDKPKKGKYQWHLFSQNIKAIEKNNQLIQLNPCFTRNYFSKCSVFLTSVTFDIHNGNFTTKITGSVGLFTRCIVLYNTDICRRKVFSCNKNAKIVKQNGQKKKISV